MLGLDSYLEYLELRNGRRYSRNSGQAMGGNGGDKDDRAGNLLVITEGEVREIQSLTQEAAVNEEIKGFIAPLICQLEELIWLIQRMVTTPHPSHYPRTDYSAICSTAAHQRDNCAAINSNKSTLKSNLRSHFGNSCARKKMCYNFVSSIKM